MGKIISRQSAGPDDPIFSGGLTTSSVPGSKKATKASPNDKDKTGDALHQDVNRVETEEDGRQIAAQRIARFQHQNKQLLKGR